MASNDKFRTFRNTEILNEGKSLTEEEVKNAFAIFIDKGWFYRKVRNDDLTITKITMKPCFVYKLESFAESRVVKRKHKPYKGGKVDGGTDALTVPVDATVPFEKRKMKFKVPHSEYVEECYACKGMPFSRCKACGGSGKMKCRTCNGWGNTGSVHTCNACGGRRQCKCDVCRGSGSVSCGTCSGNGDLLFREVLKIKWNNHVDIATVNAKPVPYHCIVKASGDILIEDWHPRVVQISDFPDENVKQVSSTIVAKHSKASFNDGIIEQRQTVSLISVAEVHYKLDETEGVFYVYGKERSVYVKNNPFSFYGHCVIH